MRITSQLLLTFILNACWQVALVAATASLGSWLLRNSVARYRHWLWATALCLAFLVPAFTSSRAFLEIVSSPVVFSSESIPPVLMNETLSPAMPISKTSVLSVVRLDQTLGLALLAIYLGFVLFRIVKLVQAWQTTRAIKQRAVELDPHDRIATIIRRCEMEIGRSSRNVKVMRSESMPVPVTIGLFHPVIILPEPLLHEGDSDLLTSAIGHEFVHVARHDYLFNLIYELLFVPIAFHPAAALMRRRIKETRELCCDELVAERIMKAEIYARSLLQLAGSAPPLRRLSVTTTVGIADADILEARIMSLLRKPELNTRWKKLLLVVVSLLLLVPCATAAAFAMRFDVDANAQEPALTQQEQKEKEELQTKERTKREDIKMRVAAEPRLREEIERKREIEMEMHVVRQAALVKLAKINMDQAIQIATSQQFGKVMECSLDASHWKEPGQLAEDGYVFYHVVIADDTGSGTTHVLVNAVDGSIIKTERELPRKRKTEQ